MARIQAILREVIVELCKREPDSVRVADDGEHARF